MIDRRGFIKGMGLVLCSSSSACAKKGKKAAVARNLKGPARVAVVNDHGVRKGSGFDSAKVSSLLQKAIAGAFGTEDAFGGLRKVIGDDDVVGIKLNCLAGPPLSPTRELTDALVEVLVKVGVKTGNIIFFERSERDIRKGGFEVNKGGEGPLFIGNDTSGIGYEREVAISGEVGSCLSRVLTRKISVLINLGVLKDHNLAGVGAGMKNLFGVIHNPNKFHENYCDPFVADVLAFDVVQEKLRLTIIDAMTAQCHGGPGYLPGYTWQFDGVIASTDPVALDRVAWDILEKRRAEKGLKPLAKENRKPKWIRTAARKKLGIDDMAKIEIVGQG